MRVSTLCLTLASWIALASPPRAQTPPPNILEQYPQDGDRKYLVVNVGFTGGSEVCTGGSQVDPVCDRDDLLDMAANLKDELESKSHAADPLDVTVHVPQNVILDHSVLHYRSFMLNPSPCGTYSNETRPMAELRHDIRAELPGEWDLESYDRIVYVVDRFAWTKGNGGQGTLNQRETFVDLSLNEDPESWHYGVIHELGHTFMCEHANVFLPTCTNAAGELGLEIEYADQFDPMGTGEGHWFHPWYMLRIGWLPATSVQDVVDMQVTYEIQPIEATPSTSVPSALRVRLDDNTNAWIFWRKYAGGQHLTGATITLESESPISRSLLIKTVETESCPTTFPPPLPSLANATLAPMETFALNLPGVVSGQPWKTTGVTVGNLGVSGDEMTIGFTGPGGFTAGTSPVIGRAHDEPASGAISGEFTYEFTAYRPAAGSDDGDGITSVRLRLFEWVDPVRGATFGIPHCPIGPAATPADPPYPAPQLPRHPTSYFCSGSLPTTMVGAPDAPLTQAPYSWTFDTTTVPNGCYWMFVQATGDNDTKTVAYWPHIIYNAPE